MATKLTALEGLALLKGGEKRLTVVSPNGSGVRPSAFDVDAEGRVTGRYGLLSFATVVGHRVVFSGRPEDCK